LSRRMRTVLCRELGTDFERVDVRETADGVRGMPADVVVLLDDPTPVEMPVLTECTYMTAPQDSYVVHLRDLVALWKETHPPMATVGLATGVRQLSPTISVRCEVIDLETRATLTENWQPTRFSMHFKQEQGCRVMGSAERGPPGRNTRVVNFRGGKHNHAEGTLFLRGTLAIFLTYDDGPIHEQKFAGDFAVTRERDSETWSWSG